MLIDFSYHIIHMLQQNEKILMLEEEVRMKNIIIKGVNDKENEDRTEMENKIQEVTQTMGVNCDEKLDIDEVIRIDRYKTDKKRPILLKVTKENIIIKALRKGKNLKSTEI